MSDKKKTTEMLILMALACGPLSIVEMKGAIDRSQMTIRKSVYRLVNERKKLVIDSVSRRSKNKGPAPYRYRLANSPHEPQKFWVTANTPVLRPVINLQHGDKIIGVEFDPMNGTVKFCVETS